MKSKFAPSPVTVLRPDANGTLVVAEVIANPERRFIDNGWEPEVQKQAYRLIAIQETGEEMFAGMISDTMFEKVWVKMNISEYTMFIS